MSPSNIPGESSTTSDENQLQSVLRGNTLATKCMDYYIKELGFEYGKKLLGRLIEKVADDENHPFEVDPRKLNIDNEPEKEKIIAANAARLENVTQQFIDVVVGDQALLLCPPELRTIAEVIAKTATFYEMDAAQIAPLVASFIVLRGFSPIILFPDMKKVTTRMISPSLRRSFVLISKTVQNLANDVEFGLKEEYMSQFNSLIMSNRAKMNEFLLKFSNQSGKQQSPRKNSSLTKEQLGEELMKLHEIIMENESSTIKQHVHPYFPQLDRPHESDDPPLSVRSESQEPQETSSKGKKLPKLNMNAVRSLVSKKKVRTKDGEFDLDMTFITPRVAAMGWPSAGAESLYRNKMSDVKKFLEEKYPDHYMVWNLCAERAYDPAHFHGRVNRIAFFDHNPPVFHSMLQFCLSLDDWLNEDDENVAFIHCKAGKGRSGVMVCCHLLFSGQCATASESLEIFGTKRTKNGKGVTIPSQIRYVHYFAKALAQAGGRDGVYKGRLTELVPMPYRALLVSKIVIHCGSSSINTPITICIHKAGKWYYNEEPTKAKKGAVLTRECGNVEIFGDVAIAFIEATKSGEMKGELFKLWINTSMIENNHVRLVKHELDGFHKNKSCSNDFAVEIFFNPV